MKLHSDAAVGGRRKFFEVPFFYTGEAMLSHALSRAKPGKNNRHPTADGFFLREPTALVEKEHRRFIVLLEVGYVSAVRINCCSAPTRDDFEHRKLSASVQEDDATWGGGRGLIVRLNFAHRA